jgi:cytochrome c biogenesis protein
MEKANVTEQHTDGQVEQPQQQEPGAEKGFLDRLWDRFASVKLAIVIFSLIALTSVVGTVIEQNADPQKNLQIIAKFVGWDLAPAAFKFFEALGFMDMYHAWWFVALQALFAINLIVCSLERIPPVWRACTSGQKPLEPGQFRGFPVKREFLMQGSPEAVRPAVEKALATVGFKRLNHAAIEGGGMQLFGQRDRWARLGVYITHLSILIILIGAVIGVFFGFNGFLNLPEGYTYPVAFSRNPVPEALWQERQLLTNTMLQTGGDLNAASQQLGVTPDRLVSRLRRLGVEPLGFEITCNDFEVSFYGTSDMPKDYASYLTVTDGGQRVIDNQRIEVNDPLRYNGYTFYQSSYSMFGDPSQYVYIFTVQPAGASAPERVEARLGESFEIAGTGITVTVAEFSPSLSIGADGNAYTYKQEMMNNPAVKVELEQGGRKNVKWIMKRYPDTWTTEGHTLGLLDVWGGQFTGLQVRRDPGVAFVYLGCLIMSVGLYMTFFMSHRRVWVRMAPEAKGTRVTLAGTAHKAREGFERRMEHAINLLTEGGKS